MKIEYDPEVDVLDIYFQRGKYKVSNEIADGIIIDYTKDRKIISIEILDASKRMPVKDMRDVTVGLPIKAES